MKVSVIIAVYNTQEYITECLDSLLRQSHQDWEAICVDDGSTDNSYAIMNQYAKEDPRIKLYSMSKNCGQAKARNEALKHSEGEVISFLDSDDWLSDDALEQITAVFEKYKNTGCVLYDCKLKFSDREESFHPLEFEVLSGTKAAFKSLSWDGIHGIYAVRNDIHQQHKYDDSSKWFSDDNTTFMHFYASREVRKCSGIYYYRMREGSVTHKVSVHHFDIIEAKDSLRDTIVKLEVPEKYLVEMEKQRWLTLIDCYMYFYINKSAFTNDDRKQITERMRKCWQGTNASLLTKDVKGKFGYKVCSSWEKFVKQENFYFFMRKLFRKL